MKRLRKQEAQNPLCVFIQVGYLHRWPPAPLQPSSSAGDTRGLYHKASCSQKLSRFSSHTACPSCSSSSASDFIWLPENGDYVTPRFRAPALFKGLPEVRALPEKTRQLGSWICSYPSAQTPQGRHPGREYIQDTWVNKNVSPPEPKVNQSLFKSAEIKHVPVLRELTQTHALLDPKQHLNKTQDTWGSNLSLFRGKLFPHAVDKNMPFLPCLRFASWKEQPKPKSLNWDITRRFRQHESLLSTP